MGILGTLLISTRGVLLFAQHQDVPPTYPVIDPPTTTGAAREELFALKTLTLPGKGRGRLTLLPPPGNRGDPLAIVDLARAAEVSCIFVQLRKHMSNIDMFCD